MLRIFTAIFMLSFVIAAHAADAPRKIDFTAVLTDQDDQPLQECADLARDPGEKCKVMRPMTLGSIALRALSVGEQGLSQDDSLKRGQLGLAVYKASAAELSADEIALIKKQIAKTSGPFIVARTFPLLDPTGR